MAYEVFLKPKEDLSLKAFQDFFSGRNNCRIEGDKVIYENRNTGVGFYFEYMVEESGSGSPNVHAGDIYRICLCVEYCQPAFFFVEALYEIHDLVQHKEVDVYDPQMGSHSTGWPFNDKKMFNNWTQCNEEAVYDYLMDLGADMANVPVMPYETTQKVWEWNYFIERLHEMLDEKIQIPPILPVEFDGEDLTAVVWKDAAAVAIPYVDVIVFARSKKGGGSNKNKGDDDFDYCAIDYEDVKPLIKKYSKNNFANAYLLDYDTPPEELTEFMNSLDSRADFKFMNMCDVIEYEVVEQALFPEEDEETQNA